MKIKLLLLVLTIILINSIDANSQSILLPTKYPLILEKLIFFKKNQFKVFYGGPIENDGKGVQWLMPVIFEDETHNTRAVYEIAFVNCDLESAHDGHIYFIDASDISIKFKNNLSDEYKLFSTLITGNYSDAKYIVVRRCDIATVFFPDIFVSSLYSKDEELDKYKLIQFLYSTFKTQQNFTVVKTQKTNIIVEYENHDEIVCAPIPIETTIENKPIPFWVRTRIRKNDLWKIYYIISTQPDIALSSQDNILLRIDSGCVSGQIYDDNACDCLDQLHDALSQIAKDKDSNGIIIHIPSHDGRGFGSAPKAETEIYKRGGCGRVHKTSPLNTIEAAHLLYGTDIYDLRTFDGIADLLRDMAISKVILVTDNIAKITSLQNNNIEVIRQKTDTKKLSCNNHIEAKKNSPFYFTE